LFTTQPAKPPQTTVTPTATHRDTARLPNRLLPRPEIAALIAPIFIVVFFLLVAPPLRSADSWSTVLYSASLLGIVATGVGLLMIGGEFDLSAGVVVTSAGLLNAMFCYQLNLNLWFGAVVSLLFCLSVGFLNGYLVMRTGIPSFLITLGTFFVLQGANLGLTKVVTGSVSSPDISGVNGFGTLHSIFASS